MTILGKIIERFLSQKCIGYSSDFRYTYFDEVILYKDGSVSSRRVKYAEGSFLAIDATGETPAVPISPRMKVSE